MRKYYKNWKRIFRFPDNGANATTGSVGNPSAGQAGGGADDGSSGGFQDPTAVLTDLDDLTPEIRKVIEDSRAGFATLQNQLKQTAADKLAEENRRKDFQSKFDQLQSQVKSLNGQTQQNQDPDAQSLKDLEDILIAEGVDPKFAPAQARILHKTSAKMAEKLQAQIGKDLQPFASTIVSREAEFAWQQAVATDKTGALQNPEIAQTIWDKVQLMAQNGQQVNATIVQNLTGMEVFARMQNGTFNPSTPTTQVQQTQQQQQFPNVGRLTYPGAGNNTTRPVPFDPNAARTTLDPDTDAALQTVYREWNKGDGAVKAPGYRPPTTKGRR